MPSTAKLATTGRMEERGILLETAQGPTKNYAQPNHNIVVWLFNRFRTSIYIYIYINNWVALIFPNFGLRLNIEKIWYDVCQMFYAHRIFCASPTVCMRKSCSSVAQNLARVRSASAALGHHYDFNCHCGGGASNNPPNWCNLHSPIPILHL